MQSQSRDNLIVGDLTVTTNRLDDILRGISRSIAEHERALTKLNELENQQILIRKDVHNLKLTQISKDVFKTVGIPYQISVDEDRIGGDRHVSTSEDSKFDCQQTDSISCHKLQQVRQDVQRLNMEMETATLRDLRRDIVGIKATIIQLQSDLNIELADSAEISNQVDYLKTNLLSIEKEIGAAAHSTAIIDIKQKLNDNNDKLVKSIQTLEDSFRTELDCQMQNHTSEIKATFNSLENLLKRRQSQFESRLATFAKNSELVALVDNVDHDNNDHRKRLEIIEKSIVFNEQTVLDMKHRTALITIRKCNLIWRRKIVQMAMSKWNDYVKQVVEVDKRAIQRRKKIRQLLIKHWFGRKQNAWNKWLVFIQLQKKLELLKSQGAKLIYNRMKNSLQAPLYHAFNKLRRLTISSKIQRARIEENKTDSDYEGLTRPESYLTEIHSNQFDLSAMIHTFKNDKDGAIHTLAQEVNNIRCFDIKKVRRDFQQSDVLIQEKLEKSISEEVLKMEEKMSSLERKVDENFDCLATQLPDMKMHISELRSSLHGTINRVKIIEQTHRDRIELLCESKEISDEKIVELESDLKQALVKIRSLEYNNDRSQNLINTLLQKMNDFEQTQRRTRESVGNQIDELQNRLDSMNSELSSGFEDRKELHNILVGVKNDVIQAKIASESSVHSVHDILDSYGIRKPKLRTIIEDGVLYENIAKEKNYVVQINSVFNDGTDDIDITSHITSFAFEYAAWIAYLADQEALQLVVNGKNPEGVVYLEDDVETRRKDLLNR